MHRSTGIRLGPPDEVRGALGIWLILSSTVVLLSAWTVSDCPFWERGAFALVLTIPSLFLAKRGHFGEGRWSFPSITAQIYLVWNLGLLPSLAAAQSPETGLYLYHPVAKLVGCLAYLVWFAAFSWSAGRPHRGEIDPAPNGDRYGIWALLGLLVLWTIPYGVVAGQGMLSSWGQKVKMEEVGGTSEGVVFLVYNAFVGLLPLISFWAWLRSRGRWRWIFSGILFLSALALVVYSNRRITLVSCAVGLYFLYRVRGELRWKWILIAGATVGLMMGPLLWPLRMALQNPDLLRAQDNTLEIATEAMTRYLTDPEFRELAALAGKENLQGGRFNYADTYLATVQWNLENGYYRSPSFLFAPVTMVPSSVWPAKNEVAVGLNIKRQVNEIGLSNEPDFPMTPIQESFFQLSYVGVLLGGLFWGWYSRQLEKGLPRAWGRLEGMLVWTAFLFGAMSFEGFFTMFLPQAREPMLLAALLFLGRKALARKAEDSAILAPR